MSTGREGLRMVSESYRVQIAFRNAPNAVGSKCPSNCQETVQSSIYHAMVPVVKGGVCFKLLPWGLQNKIKWNLIKE